MDIPSQSKITAESVHESTLPPLIYVLIAISGMSGLIYEIIWIRALGLHFGISTPAITTVVATFMAGLGLGNALLGRYSDRVLRPISFYRRIEFSIAASGLIVSLLVLRAGPWMDTLSRLCSVLGPWSLLGNALALALLIAVPCTLMGGTLPILSRAFVREGHSGRAVGALYVSNTIGALVGALLPDFVLIPSRGLTFAALFAAAGNLFVAWAFGRMAVMRASAVPIPVEVEPNNYRRALPVPVAAWLLTIVSGLVGMALEVLWSRTLSQWTVGLVTSFAVLLAVYLSMLALGAALTRTWADRCKQPLLIASSLLSFSGLAALIPIVLAPAWLRWQTRLWPILHGVERPGLMHRAVDALTHALYLESGACILMGAAFPFVAAAMVREGTAGTGTGRLLTVNTLAGTVGALLAGFVWLPLFGEQNSYLAAAFVMVLGATVATVSLRGKTLRHQAFAFGSLILVLATIVSLPRGRLARTYFAGNLGHVIAFREGSTTAAAVAEHMAYGQLHYLELLTPGTSMSDTNFPARRYMGMMAHAAMLASRKPERALLICYGTGNTASSLLSYPELQQLDVVDISREVLDLATVFGHNRGSDPLTDPRTHVFVEDGRHHLIVKDESYDIITLEPPPPNHAGIVNLYSREFYNLAKHRLRRGGVITQWLPVFELSQADILAMVSAFVSEIPHTVLLYGISRQFILIGSCEPLSIDPRDGLRRTEAPSTARNLKNCGIAGLPDVYGAVLQTDSELRYLVRNTPPLSDDLPSIQYPWQDIHSPNYAVWFGSNPSRSTALLASEIDAPLKNLISAVAQSTYRVLPVVSLSSNMSSERKEILVGNAVRSALSLRPCDETLLSMLSLQNDRIVLAERVLNGVGARSPLSNSVSDLVAKNPASENKAVRDAELTIGRRAFYVGDFQTAFTLISKVTPEPTKAADRALLLGGCLRTLGHFSQAADAFETAGRVSHDKVFKIVAHRLAEQVALPFHHEAGPLVDQ